MTEAAPSIPAANGTAEKAVQEPIVKIVIRHNLRTGDVTIEGPIENKVLSFGILECARDAINQWHEEMQRKQSLKPRPGEIPPGLKQ